MVTVTKKDLVALGYGNSFAADIIRQAKNLMVERGYTYYHSRKLERVPAWAIEEILGIAMNGDAADCTPKKGVNTSGKRHDKESQ
mgnify:CR=1 FL=1